MSCRPCGSGCLFSPFKYFGVILETLGTLSHFHLRPCYKQLNKLTVATLKAYLSSVKVEPVGKKADLIAQVEAYFSS